MKEIKLTPKNWLVDIKNAHLKAEAEKYLTFLSYSYTQKTSYPVHLYGLRGFKAGLVDYLNTKMEDYHFSLDIPPISYDKEYINNKYELRDYQSDPVELVAKKGYGIVASPTASGKTRMEIALCEIFPKPLLYIVPSKILLYQAKEELEKWGFSVGLCGDGYTNLKKDITVMIVNSLVIKRNKNSKSRKALTAYLKSVKSIIFDEVHHGTKKCYSVLGRCPALYRAGFSATPWAESDEKLTQARLMANFGDIIFDGREDDRVDPFIEHPIVYTIKRGANYEHQTLLISAIVDRSYLAQKRYALSMDSARNKFILDISELLRLKGNNIYIVVGWTEQVDQLRSIAEATPDDYQNIHFLTGATPKEEREEVYNSIGTTDPLIICGTVGGEGVDLPHLNFVVMGDIGKSEIKVIQAIGRAARKAEGKTVASVVDIYDPIFHSHYKHRKKIYKNEGFEMKSEEDLFTLLAED